MATPPADFRAVNTQVFSALGVSAAQFAAGAVTKRKDTASAPVSERFQVAHVGAWTTPTTVKLVDGKGRWLVSWSPTIINPALHPGDRLLMGRNWPARAPILGAGGAPLVADHGLITIGIVGSRIKSHAAIKRDLLAAGAPAPQTSQARAQAKAHPGYFDPVFQISNARFEQLKRQSGPDNVYTVGGGLTRSKRAPG